MNAEVKIRDAQRRLAMIEADSDRLSALLDDALTWTHSSGENEDKAAILASIESGHVVYDQLDIAQDRVQQFSDTYVHSGVVSGRARRDGKVKALHARFLSVWHTTPSGLMLVAWQSTNTNR